MKIFEIPNFRPENLFHQKNVLFWSYHGSKNGQL